MKIKKTFWMIGIVVLMAGLAVGSFFFIKLKFLAQPVFNPKSEIKLEDAQILVLGDSIFGNLRNSRGVCWQLEKQTGADVYNGAFGGTSAALGQDKTSLLQRLSFVRLAESIENRSYTDIERNVDRIYYTSIPYIEEPLEILKGLNYEDIDYVLIAYGANDYFSGISVKDYSKALEKGMKQIQKAFPNARLVLCTPIYCNFEKTEGMEGDCNSRDVGEGTIVAYVEAVLKLAKDLGVDCINGYEGLDINAENWSDYSQDGIHPNAKGGRTYARLIADELEGGSR